MNFKKNLIIGLLSTIILNTSFTYSMKDSIEDTPKSENKLLEIANLNILPIEIQKEIFNNIFNVDFDFNYIFNLSLNKANIFNHEDLIKIINLKTVNKDFNYILKENYKKEFKKIYHILGLELIKTLSKIPSKTTKEDFNIAIDLIKNGANVNLFDKNKKTALFMACMKERKDIVKLLLENGASKTIDNHVKMSKQTALLASTKNTDIVELLLKHKVYINKVNKTSGRSALMIAAERGETETVKILIQNGANLNLQNLEGKTALDLAKNAEIKNLIEKALESSTQNK